ncbi:DUF4276 family protein [Limisalsivibrio acetivorans]|uniref:DUF4276 family protein n=1 Tax=Limisalsivibrio acetivorans TaxID=1304888 RepID=UPI0003B4FA61|nr:DUF4276 family protein [Limisalsivibrio acetivorans]
MKTLACFVEEQSAEEMLSCIIKKLFTEKVDPKIIVFEGKGDFDKNIEGKLKNWKKPDTLFLLFRDKDHDDCVELKSKYLQYLEKYNLDSCSIVRIACRELESFYLGDLEAVEKGLSINGLSKLQAKSSYRNPDIIEKPSVILKRITNQSYQKIQGSREISRFLKLDGSNRSKSFNVLIEGLDRLINS